MDILIYFLFLAIGLVIGFFITSVLNPVTKKLKQQLTETQNQHRTLETQLEICIQKEQLIRNDLQTTKLQLENEQNKQLRLTADLAALQTELTMTKEKMANHQNEWNTMEQQFKLQFTNLAQAIFEEKTQKFTEQNKSNIDQILKPLNEKLKDFEKKVDETYIKNVKDRTDLQAEIKKLFDLNNKISQEADQLAKALKGDVKMQGNWGEVILERILETSGLVKGREYQTQQSLVNETGKKYQPDVIVYLPENKHIVIDAKVSLTAYERFVNAADEEKEIHLKNHLISIKQHINELSEKNYHNLQGVNAPAYVLMFVPIESSFSIAVQEDLQLFNFAWEKQIVIVSPSTLTATLLTISSIWRQENQTKNALEIAQKSGALYDKIVGFLTEFSDLGKRIKQTQQAYDASMNKLQDGRGNIINRIEELKTLGAKTNKKLPDNYISEDIRKEDSDSI